MDPVTINCVIFCIHVDKKISFLAMPSGCELVLVQALRIQGYFWALKPFRIGSRTLDLWISVEPSRRRWIGRQTEVDAAGLVGVVADVLREEPGH